MATDSMATYRFFVKHVSFPFLQLDSYKGDNILKNPKTFWLNSSRNSNRNYNIYNSQYKFIRWIINLRNGFLLFRFRFIHKFKQNDLFIF